jgi:hypothetical protein
MKSALPFALLFSVGLLAVGCVTPPDERPGDPAALHEEIRAFHTNLRWARWEHASRSIHDAYVHEFMGRYEELGEDYRVVDVTTVNAEISDDGFSALVEVDQEWYQLPSTTVQKVRFVERWVWDDDRWSMRERMPREEYRELGRVFPSEAADRERAERERAEEEERQQPDP